MIQSNATEAAKEFLRDRVQRGLQLTHVQRLQFIDFFGFEPTEVPVATSPAPADVPEVYKTMGIIGTSSAYKAGAANGSTQGRSMCNISATKAPKRRKSKGRKKKKIPIA